MTIQDPRVPCRIISLQGYGAGETAWFHPSHAQRLAQNGAVQILSMEEKERMLKEREKKMEEQRQSRADEAEEFVERRARYFDKMVTQADVNKSSRPVSKKKKKKKKQKLREVVDNDDEDEDDDES